MMLVRAPRVFHDAVLAPGEVLEFPEPLRGAVAVEVEPAAPRDAYTSSAAAWLRMAYQRMPVPTTNIDAERKRGGAWGFVSNDLPFVAVEAAGPAPIRVRVWAMEARVEGIPAAAIRAYRVLPTVPRDAIVERVYRVEFPGSDAWTKIAEVEPSFRVGASIISRKMIVCVDCPGVVLLRRGRYWDDFHPRDGRRVAPNVPTLDVGFAWNTIFAQAPGTYTIRVVYALDAWPMEVVA